MSERFKSYVILLRAIGPATHPLMSMSDWRNAAENCGFLDATTYLNTGNMIAGFAGSSAGARKKMTEVLRSFGLQENVRPFIRSAHFLLRLHKTNPAGDRSKEHPREIAVYFFENPEPDFTWLPDHDGRERHEVFENHLIVDFRGHTSSPEAGRLMRKIDKYCGASTARSWTTIGGLAARCRRPGER